MNGGNFTEACTSDNGDRWEIFKDSAGKWRWRHMAKNGEIVGAASEGYVAKMDCVTNARSNGMDCNPA